MALERDVLVVGTGYGGATAAAVLARAGMRVGILERGTWWGAADGHRPLPETLPQLLRALEGVNLSTFGRSARLPLGRRGLLEVHLHGRTLMMNALAVGGTSLVNGALMQRPARAFFEALPPEVDADALEPGYRFLEEALGVAQGPYDEARYRQLATLADDEKWSLTRATQAIHFEDGGPGANECTRCNRCIVGCNIGAKQSLDRTLIPEAVEAGAELRDLCAVETIHPIEDGYEVRFRDARTRERQAWRARRVVLAAGTLNTLKILFRSRDAADGLRGLSKALGARASLGGDALGFYRVADDLVPAQVDGHSSDLLFEVPGRDGDRDFAFGALTAPVMPRSALLRWAQGRRTLSLAGFGHDAMDGRVDWNGRGVELQHRPQAVVGRTLAAMDRVAKTYGWGGATRDPARPARSWMSVHPMGGGGMASDRTAGVVDFRGEVFGHPGLHVADASIFASAPAAGPALSIAALAWWISQRILEDAGCAA